jgi:hypothetical protein
MGNLLATGEREEMMKARINARYASTSGRNGLRRAASVHRQRYHVGRPCASLVRIRGRQGKPGSSGRGQRIALTLTLWEVIPRLLRCLKPGYTGRKARPTENRCLAPRLHAAASQCLSRRHAGDSGPAPIVRSGSATTATGAPRRVVPPAPAPRTWPT